MALATECQTPGAIYHTKITREDVVVRVNLPVPIFLTEEMAERLEINLHNAVELVLAPLFS